MTRARTGYRLAPSHDAELQCDTDPSAVGWHRRTLLGASAGAVALAACRRARNALPSKTLTIFQEQRVSWLRNFNPLMPPGSHRWATRAAIYEPLLIFNTMRGQYVPWLATGYAWSENKHQLQMTLRPGVKFSDGETLTADDVAFTFDLTRRFPALDEHGMWRYLARVDATDKHQILFSFQRPYTPGLFYLSKQCIVPKRHWERITDPMMFANPEPIGTGPFTEIRRFHGQIFEIDKNPHYWQPRKNGIQTLRFPAYASNEQSNLALLSGEIDWAGNFVPAIERIYVERDPKHHHYWFPRVQGSVMLYANTTRAPFNDARVRKALSMGVDREKVVKIAVHDYTVASDATAMSDAYAKYRDQSAIDAGTWVQHNPARAATLLDEAGLLRGKDGLRRRKDTTPMRYELNVVTGWSDYATSAQIIARGLRELGIEISVRAYDFNAWHDRLSRGEFDLSLGWSVESSPDPYSLYRSLMSARTRKPVGEAAPENWHRFSHDRVDELLDLFEATTDEREIIRLIHEMQALFVEHAPAIPLYPMPSWGEYNTKRVRGFPNANDPYAKLTPHAIPEALLVLTRLESA